jgi:signal peptidase I
METREKKPVKWILGGFSALIFIFAIWVMISGTIAQQRGELLWIFGYSYSIVSDATDSMVGDREDSIEPGDIVFYKKTSYEDIEVDDIIIFYNSDSKIIVVHRVIGTDDDGHYITKGDNNSAADREPVTPETYRDGKAIMATSFLSLGTVVINYRNIIFLVIVLLLVGLLVSELVKIIRHVRDEDLKKTEKTLQEAKEKAIEEEREKDQEGTARGTRRRPLRTRATRLTPCL